MQSLLMFTLLKMSTPRNQHEISICMKNAQDADESNIQEQSIKDDILLLKVSLGYLCAT